MDYFTLPDSFRILIDLSKLRDWRDVEADDANGVRRRGIFIPYLQNGIRLFGSRVSGIPLRPFLTLMALKPKKFDLVRRAIEKGQRRMVVTYIPSGNWAEMIRQGMGKEGDSLRGDLIGYVYPTDFKIPGE